jgi:hypothetical protein
MWLTLAALPADHRGQHKPGRQEGHCLTWQYQSGLEREKTDAQQASTKQGGAHSVKFPNPQNLFPYHPEASQR